MRNFVVVCAAVFLAACSSSGVAPLEAKTGVADEEEDERILDEEDDRVDVDEDEDEEDDRDREDEETDSSDDDPTDTTDTTDRPTTIKEGLTCFYKLYVFEKKLRSFNFIFVWGDQG